ncbi:hypothetical protein ACFV4E_22930 [Streptomyces hygroscopicus]|uniref:Uncharacterized protein n=1 Tax=Streptomyces hygroscopicus TaxID=1912 RepID=A0ABQ3UFF0_STRHY|nr:hypothetical protein [Streptomyces hygroscopicus]GHJ34325.1 hypothetical protein TPA0910_87580 [Streptomyces hygroscopicus]
MTTIARSKTTIGSYRTHGDARVLVIDRSESDRTILTPIVTAHCGGHGCVAAAPIERGSSFYLSRVDRDQEVANIAKTVQQWAQQHAETCRATPAPGTHPADQDLPLCGHVQPGEQGLTCQLTAGHRWMHAAYTSGSYGHRAQWESED